MRHVFIASCLIAVALSASPVMTSVQAGELPKCRNVAGYEPKAVCVARNQRAQWQAEYTAKVTAQLMADVMARQAEEDRANQKTFMDTVKGVIDGFVSTVQGLM